MTDEPKPNDPPKSGTVGEMTKFAMTVAGLDQRAAKNRIGAIVGIGLVVILTAVIVLDLTRVATIPGMGMVYDVTGVEDPNASRAVERYEAELADEELPEEKRDALRARLLGAQQPSASKIPATSKQPSEPPSPTCSPTKTSARPSWLWWSRRRYRRPTCRMV